MTPAVAAAEGVGEDGRWGEEAEPMTPAVTAAEGVGEDGRWGEEAEPMTPAVAAAEGSQGLEDRRLLRSPCLAVKSQIERTALVAVERKRKSTLRRFGSRGVTEEAERKATGGPVKVKEAAASSCSARWWTSGRPRGTYRRGIPGPRTVPVRRPLREAYPSGRWRSSPEGTGVQRNQTEALQKFRDGLHHQKMF